MTELNDGVRQNMRISSKVNEDGDGLDGCVGNSR
jgi:hypothetical protein